MKKRTATFLFITVLTTAFGINAIVRDYMIKKGFDETYRGELMSDVQIRLGEPSRTSLVCHNTHFWEDNIIENSGCVREIHYYSTFLPKYWAIGFSEKGRAVTKYEFVSH